MRVDVDEAGSDDLARRVDDAGCARLDCGRDGDDRVTADRDVTAIPRRPSPVDDARVADDEVERRGLGREGNRDAESDRDATESFHARGFYGTSRVAQPFRAAVLNPSARPAD